MSTHTYYMSKNIAISDDVYSRLKREKGDRSFSEVIASKLDTGGRLMDVTGNRIFDPETVAEIDREIGRLSDQTIDRIESSDETV